MAAIDMDWCDHCMVFCETISNDLTRSCRNCGKVLADWDTTPMKIQIAKLKKDKSCRRIERVRKIKRDLESDKSDLSSNERRGCNKVAKDATNREAKLPKNSDTSDDH